MKRILKTKKIETKAELLECINEIWEAFPQETINRLVLSFENRLRLLIQKGGQSISNILRSNINIRPAFPLGNFPDILSIHDLLTVCDPTINDETLEFHSKRPFTIEEVSLLLDLVKQYGRKWTKFSSFFKNRAALSLKQKYDQVIRS